MISTPDRRARCSNQIAQRTRPTDRLAFAHCVVCLAPSVCVSVRHQGRTGSTQLVSTSSQRFAYAEVPSRRSSIPPHRGGHAYRARRREISRWMPAADRCPCPRRAARSCASRAPARTSTSSGTTASSCTPTCAGPASRISTARTTSGSDRTANPRRRSRQRHRRRCASTLRRSRRSGSRNLPAPIVRRLGPDLCSIDTDLDRCVELLLTYDDRRAPIGEVLLDQRCPVGLGNVYRSESLVGVRAHPFAPARRSRRGAGSPHRQRRCPAAPRQPRPRRAGRPAGRAGRTRCLRSHRTGVLPLRRDRARPARRRPDRILYWCPGARPASSAAIAAPAELPTDQHPAAEAFRADDTAWLRTPADANGRCGWTIPWRSRRGTSIRLALTEGRGRRSGRRGRRR